MQNVSVKLIKNDITKPQIAINLYILKDSFMINYYIFFIFKRTQSSTKYSFTEYNIVLKFSRNMCAVDSSLKQNR